MTLLTFEGVKVDVPAIDGITFRFIDGTLSIECQNYTGNFSLSKESKVVVKSTPPRHQQRFKPNTPIIKATQSEQVSFNSLNESCMNSPLSDYVANSQEEATIPETLPILSPTPDKENISPESTKKRSRKETNTPLSMTKTLSMITPRSSGKKSKKLNRRSSLRSTASQEATPVVNPTATLTELSTSGTHPVGRWGHTATSLGTSKRIILYGGDGDEETSLGDLHVLDLASNSWSCPINCTSVPRSWHSAAYVETKNILLVFGGERTKNGVQEALSDIMVLDTDVLLWYPPGISGTSPSARSGHTCAVIGDDVLVFGGTKGRKWHNNVNALNTENWNWRELKIHGEAPPARTYHTATAMGEQMVIFGGNDLKRSFKSVHVLQRSGTDTWSWFHPCVVGKAPCARTGHSATAVDDHTILIYGGWDPQITDGDVIPFDDAYLLDTEKWEWIEVAVEGEGDSNQRLRRVGHKALLLEHQDDAIRVAIVGGQDENESRHSAIDVLTIQPKGNSIY